jgi:Na+/H+ antiporter NhaD/arsenite permease-like protein
MIALGIFLCALALIATEWAHRTKVVLVGAGAVVIAGFIDVEDAIEAIDWQTIGLLAGMMIIVRLTEPTGVFRYAALWVARVSKAQPLRLIFLLSGTTALLSAFLDNLTAILLVVPLTLVLARVLGISPVPLALTEVFASNIGGTATLIGDPPNIMIGTT